MVKMLLRDNLHNNFHFFSAATERISVVDNSSGNNSLSNKNEGSGDEDLDQVKVCDAKCGLNNKQLSAA